MDSKRVKSAVCIFCVSLSLLNAQCVIQNETCACAEVSKTTYSISCRNNYAKINTQTLKMLHNGSFNGQESNRRT